MSEKEENSVEIDNSIILDNNLNIITNLSKRQKRREIRRKKFLEIRQELRKNKKEKKRNEKKNNSVNGENIIKKQIFTMEQSKCRINVVIDMSFDELMNERTVRKTISQLAYCYATNRRTENPFQFSIVNLNGKTKKIFDTYPSYSNWNVNIFNQSLNELWSTEKIIYLTADSDNLLETLNENKIYVIGGLLDHNHYKGICLKKAEENGFAHARLPIDSFIQLSGRKVLTINQVFEILINFSQLSDWKNAFLNVIPKRKGITEKIDITE
ncbi:SAM-dependent MTase TRM10-type domain-containing protein [Meloidogyne graminicola]|uniref:tRNA (guanine(9)-N(1))-methyltransferase n=1 Tax=Meloidogyne graminicola TaxID=189291 RepID=A0A8S9ZXV1_9BILA|nr:SAM-dependent MTase TRM10-type domain-containing protein [Meloidogyne graminicola]